MVRLRGPSMLFRSGRLAFSNKLIGAILLFVISSVGIAAEYEDAACAYKAKDHPIALEKFRNLAEQGHAKAQYCLGLRVRS